MNNIKDLSVEEIVETMSTESMLEQIKANYEEMYRMYYQEDNYVPLLTEGEAYANATGEYRVFEEDLTDAIWHILFIDAFKLPTTQGLDIEADTYTELLAG